MNSGNRADSLWSKPQLERGSKTRTGVTELSDSARPADSVPAPGRFELAGQRFAATRSIRAHHGSPRYHDDLAPGTRRMCRAPTWLGMLEDRIDEILKTERFIGTPAERYKLFHAMR